MNATATNDAQVSALLGAAERAATAGRRHEAARILDEAKALAPEHPLVLNAFGMRALSQGDAAGARELFTRATASRPKEPALWLSLALACRALREDEAELAALDQALALDPYFFLALLQKATLLERQGQQKKAAGVYHAALCCLPRGQLPPALQAAVSRAREAVQINTAALEAFLRDRLEDVRARRANARLDRFDDCLEVLLGKKRVYVSQPTFMHFPYLPAVQFYERGDFPWLDALEAASDDIRSELISVLTDDASKLVPYIAYPAGAPLNQWKELNHSRKWSAFFLWREGTRQDDHIARCPKTAAALADMPMADVPGHAPTAFFSILEPKTRIPPHTGVTNTRVVVHLPLIVPANCGFRVGSDTREWVAGKAWVFDDTIEHEAWNDSEEPRAILIVDIWNPFLTEAERDLVRVTTESVAAYYAG